MTAKEISALEVLTGFVRDWRDEDREWKGKMEERLALVEDYITDAKGQSKERGRIAAHARATLALVLSSIGGAVALVSLLRPH